MDEKALRAFCFALILFCWVGIFGVILTGCDAPHLIGDGPDVCFVPDECIEDVTVEVCPDATCPDVVIIETDTDVCDLSVPVGHRPIECRGRGH
jgi:hypothetical protein